MTEQTSVILESVTNILSVNEEHDCLLFDGKIPCNMDSTFFGRIYDISEVEAPEHLKRLVSKLHFAEIKNFRLVVSGPNNLVTIKHADDSLTKYTIFWDNALQQCEGNREVEQLIMQIIALSNEAVDALKQIKEILLKKAAELQS